MLGGAIAQFGPQEGPPLISCPVKYEYPNLMLLDLGPKQVLVIVSIHVSLRTPTGYLLPDDMETSPHQNDKTNRQ
jgi:hypothetical protein